MCARQAFAEEKERERKIEKERERERKREKEIERKRKRERERDSHLNFPALLTYALVGVSKTVLGHELSHFVTERV